MGLHDCLVGGNGVVVGCTVVAIVGAACGVAYSGAQNGALDGDPGACSLHAVAVGDGGAAAVVVESDYVVDAHVDYPSDVAY